jgi:Domain of unknown function (DU1801)
MLRPIDEWFLKQEEPEKSCLEFLRIYIPSIDKRITEEWKFGLPFYYINGKMFCYLWIHKKFKMPYISIADGNKISHPDLLVEKRKRFKILLIDPAKNIPVKKINQILKAAASLHKNKGE